MNQMEMIAAILRQSEESNNIPVGNLIDEVSYLKIYRYNHHPERKVNYYTVELDGNISESTFGDNSEYVEKQLVYNGQAFVDPISAIAWSGWGRIKFTLMCSEGFHQNNHKISPPVYLTRYGRLNHWTFGGMSPPEILIWETRQQAEAALEKAYRVIGSKERFLKILAAV